MKYKIRILIENIILFAIFATIIFYIIRFAISFFGDYELKLPSVDANLSFVQINTDVLINKYIQSHDEKNESNVSSKTISKYTIENNSTQKENMSMNEDLIKQNITNEDLIEQNITNEDLIKNNIKKEDLIEKNISSTQSIINTINQTIDINNTNIIKTIPKNNNKKANITKKNNLIKQIKISKQDMLIALNMYIDNAKKEIKINTILSQNIRRKTVSIRLTVLKSGDYQNIKFIRGDAQLFKAVKKAVKKVFPLYLNEKIVDQFPRYLRLKLNYNEQY